MNEDKLEQNSVTMEKKNVTFDKQTTKQTSKQTSNKHEKPQSVRHLLKMVNISGEMHAGAFALVARERLMAGRLGSCQMVVVVVGVVGVWAVVGRIRLHTHSTRVHFGVGESFWVVLEEESAHIPPMWV